MKRSEHDKPFAAANRTDGNNAVYDNGFSVTKERERETNRRKRYMEERGVKK